MTNEGTVSTFQPLLLLVLDHPGSQALAFSSACRIRHEALFFVLQDTTRELVGKVAKAELPDVWVALSKAVKEEILHSLLQSSERFIELLMVALQAEIQSILDMKGLMASIVAEDKQVCRCSDVCMMKKGSPLGWSRFETPETRALE